MVDSNLAAAEVHKIGAQNNELNSGEALRSHAAEIMQHEYLQQLKLDPCKVAPQPGAGDANGSSGGGFGMRRGGEAPGNNDGNGGGEGGVEGGGGGEGHSKGGRSEGGGRRSDYSNVPDELSRVFDNVPSLFGDNSSKH